jgi:hypothetical protein
MYTNIEILFFLLKYKTNMKAKYDVGYLTLIQIQIQHMKERKKVIILYFFKEKSPFFFVCF